MSGTTSVLGRPASPACVPRVSPGRNVARASSPSTSSATKCTSKSLFLLASLQRFLSISPPALLHNRPLILCAHLDPLRSNRLCHDAVAFPTSPIAAASVVVSWSYDPILSHAARIAHSHRCRTRAAGRPIATHKRQ